MAHRLYPATRAFFQQVLDALTFLGLGAVFPSSLTLQLAALYICGLIFLDKHQTQCRIVQRFPARAHDALNRLLRTLDLSTDLLMDRMIKLCNTFQNMPGYFMLDDVVIEKPDSKLCPFVGYCHSTSRRRTVRGLHVVVLVWCSLDGRYRIPVGFRLWKPKDRCKKDKTLYRTKLELAKDLVARSRKRHLKALYITFDAWYAADWFLRWLDRRGMIWVTELSCDRLIWSEGEEVRVDLKREDLSFRYHYPFRMWIATILCFLPSYGRDIRLVVTQQPKKERKESGGVKEGPGRRGSRRGVKKGVEQKAPSGDEWECHYLATNDRSSQAKGVVRRQKSRFRIEEVFRAEKQYAGLGACQSWKEREKKDREHPMKRHIALSLIAFVVLQRMRKDPNETPGQVKERWMLDLIRQGHSSPQPLRGKEKLAM